MVATLDNALEAWRSLQAGQTGVKERLDGALEVIKASGKDIQIIDQQPADWMKDKAFDRHAGLSHQISFRQDQFPLRTG